MSPTAFETFSGGRERVCGFFASGPRVFAMLVAVAGNTIFATPADAGPAVRLVVSNDICWARPCEGPPPPAPPPLARSGETTFLAVAAVDASGLWDVGYTGTVTFAATDRYALLPSPYTFTAGDRGGKFFPLVLYTIGDQTVSVSDREHGLTGQFTLTVTGPAAVPIPTLDRMFYWFLAVLIAASGVWLLIRSKG